MEFSIKAVVAFHIPQKAYKCPQKDVIFFRGLLLLIVISSSIDLQGFFSSTFSTLRIVCEREDCYFHFYEASSLETLVKMLIW